jgi:Domain of unknown function (DUF4062)
MNKRATTDRRYQIFISSTFKHLHEERKAAIEAVFERGHIPIALERFSPSNTSDLEVIRTAMEDSQVYILILGHTYGELSPDGERSYTEVEYDLAQEYGLLTLVFLIDKHVVHERRKELNEQLIADKHEIDNYVRFNKFRERIKKKHSGKIFTPGPEFKGLVALALADNLGTWDKPGFIREPADPAVLEGARNEFIGDLVTELRSFEKLYDRTQQAPEAKRCAARFFVQQYMDRILDNRVSLFFESGSTIAFLAKEMSGPLYKAVTITDDGTPSIQISTNNVLAYLLLWLKARIPCTKFPWSPPVETTYGAAYGGLETIIDQDPDYKLPPLNASARREIARLENSLFTISSMKRPTLLLGAASGLQLTPGHTLIFQDKKLSKSRMEELEAQLRQCFGPHVGSYRNKVFKRFMYDTSLPMVIFLTGDKINCPIEVGKCHFILDSVTKWDNFYHQYPLAFCVASRHEEKAFHVKLFHDLGFDVLVENNAAEISSLIARNKPFITEFEARLG